jgi:glycosyltransferase involved in cell wall biosynthesis
MRILEIETFGRGGLAHYAYNLSRALAERGHEVTLVTSVAWELGDRALPASFRVVKEIGRLTHRPGGGRSGFIGGLVRKGEAVVDAFVAAARALRIRPDVIHLHCTNPISLLYLMLLRLSRAPLVATAHVVTPHERIPLQGPVYRAVHRLSHLIIAHSDFDRKRLLDEFGIPGERIVVIPHGEYGFFGDRGTLPDREVARRRLGLGAEDEVALFFGYVREYKGLDLLLDAWPAVAEARPRGRLVVAGDPVRLPPVRRAELEARAARLGAIHRFEYVPFSDVGLYFGAADVLALPYRRLSQSGVLYLALSLGVPVVGTRVGALEEVLRDGDSAVLVPADSPPALAEALVRVLASPALRERLARGGRQVAARHSWPAIAERTEAAFAALIAA